MSSESLARIEWSPDGARVLVCRRGALEIRTPGGALVRELPPRTVQLGAAPHGGVAFSMVPAEYLDARWLPDGRIIAVDIFGMPVGFTMQGARYGEPVAPANPWRVPHAQLAAGGGAYVMLDRHQPAVHATSPAHPRLWFLLYERRWYGLPHGAAILAAALSPDASLLALAYGTDLEHGWIVVDLTPQKDPDRLSGTWRAPVLDRASFGVGRETLPASVFGFERTRRRLAVVAPGPGPGTLRLGAPGPTPSAHTSGATTVALDERGIRAAYAYPPGIGEATLRVDYLSPATKGPRVIEILDTQWIEPGIGDLAALAFDPPGHHIACLGADGRVEVVPVP